MAFNLANVRGYGDGSLGVVVENLDAGNVNSYARVSNLSATSVTIDSATAKLGAYEKFTAGNEIMFHVSAAVASTSTDYLGRWGFAKILSVTDNVLFVDADLTQILPLDQFGKYHCQVVTVAQFESLTLNGDVEIVPAAYSSSAFVGGIVAIKCSNALTFDGGNINVAGRGIPVASKALRPVLAQEKANAGLRNYDKFAGWENHITRERLLLNAGDGVVFIAAKNFSGDIDSRIGNPAIAAYNSDDIIFLAPDMKISDAVFNADSVEISFADGSTATIGGINYGSRVQFVDSEEKRHVVTFNFGRIVEGDAVTLTSDFAADVFDAGAFTSVTAAKSPVQITGSNQPSSLIGGKNSDTLVGNSPQDTFTGGGGSNVFVVKHDATITDFHPAADKLIVDSAAFDGVHLDASGLTLTSGSDQIVLCDVEAGTVTVNDTPIFFSDGIIANAEKTSITLVGGQLDCADFPTADIAEAHVNTSVKARDSGMILTGHDATLVGGGGNDTFLCADDLTLQAVGGGDCISLDGFTLQSSDYSRVTERLSLKISDGNSTANIVVENYDRTEPVPVWQIVGDATVSLYPDIPDEFIFSSDNPRNATQVTVNAQHGDFGRQSSIPPPSTDDHIGRQEYYLSLYTVQAAQSDSTLIANQKVNYIFAIGGTRNALTGGLAADRFNFSNSGGVVTDFGVGATASNKATETTSRVYDRNDPRTYAEGIDILQVNGVVKEVAFDGYKQGSATAANETFVAYVTYTAADGNDYTVALLNICKKASNSAYQTDDVAAKSLKIWDTSSGEMKVISATDLAKRFVNTEDSAFAENIANIADMVAQYHHNNGIIGR